MQLLNAEQLYFATHLDNFQYNFGAHPWMLVVTGDKCGYGNITLSMRVFRAEYATTPREFSIKFDTVNGSIDFESMKIMLTLKGFPSHRKWWRKRITEILEYAIEVYLDESVITGIVSISNPDDNTLY